MGETASKEQWRRRHSNDSIKVPEPLLMASDNVQRVALIKGLNEATDDAAIESIRDPAGNYRQSVTKYVSTTLLIRRRRPIYTPKGTGPTFTFNEQHK